MSPSHHFLCVYTGCPHYPGCSHTVQYSYQDVHTVTSPPRSVSPPLPVDAELEPDQTSAPSGQAGEPSTSQQAKAEQRSAGGAGEQPNTAKVHGKMSFCGVGQILTRCTLCSVDDDS